MHDGGHALQVVVTMTGKASARVQPSGALDEHTAGLFAAVLSDTYYQGCTDVSVDLSCVTSCDEAGIDVIVGAHHYVESCRKVFELHAAPDWLAARLRGAGIERALAESA